MIVLKTPEEIARIRLSGRVVHEALQAMQKAIVPGVSTTQDLENAAIEVLTRHGATSPFLGYKPSGHPPYPAWTCVSVNDELVHGVPGRRVLQDGDIVSCDVGCLLNGYYGDSAWTFAVGSISKEAERLMRVTREALLLGIEQARPGNRVGDIGSAIERYVRKAGFSVVREMVGHGVGKALHEEPQVPNFGRPGTGVLLQAGMTLAIEPMVNAGGREIRTLADGWTIATADGSLSAHFEHTIAITDNGPVILTQGS